MDGTGPIHEFMEGESINFGNLFFAPVMTNSGCYSSHFTGLFIFVKSVPIMNIVWESIVIGCRDRTCPSFRRWGRRIVINNYMRDAVTLLMGSRHASSHKKFCGGGRGTKPPR
jgi:hypothetical protein